MSPQYLLDTCAWLDLRLSPELIARRTMEIIGSQSTFCLSAISLVEVSRKTATGDLILDAPVEQWLDSATIPELIHLVEITVPIAVDAYSLPGDFHKDPADRLIVATARVHRLTIITSDRKILDYPHVRTLSTR